MTVEMFWNELSLDNNYPSLHTPQYCVVSIEASISYFFFCYISIQIAGIKLE